REARLVAGSRLGLALLRRRELDRRVLSDGEGRVDHGRGASLLAGDGQDRFVVPSGLRARECAGRGPPRSQAREVEQIRKYDLDAGRPVGALESQAIGAAVKDAI